MNTCVLLLQLLSVLSVERTRLIQEDTCGLYQVKIDTPFMEITNYKTYYDSFVNNDSSEYQVIAITIPYDDSNAYGMYYCMTDSASVSMIEDGLAIRKTYYDIHDTKYLSTKLGEIERGGYASICDLDAYSLIYYLCMIKKKGEIVFQFQGINKNIIGLGGKGKPIKNVISLIKELRE